MAIKGKKKPKSGGRRPKAPAPKREVVVRKESFWGKRWVQFSALGLFALLIGLALGYGFGNEATIGRTQAEEKAISQAQARFQEQVDAVLMEIGTVRNGKFIPFPPMAQAIAALQVGENRQSAMRDLDEVITKAKDAVARFDAIDPRTLAPEVTVDVHNHMESVLTALTQSTLAMSEAAQLAKTEDPRAMAAALEIGRSASTISDEAYQRYLAGLQGARITLSELNQQLPPITDPQGNITPPEGFAPPQDPTGGSGAVPPAEP